MGKLLFFVAWVLAAFLAWQQVSLKPAWQPIVWSDIQASTSQIIYQEHLIPNGNKPSSHSVSATVLPSGQLVSFWFAGASEGAKDVQIMQSFFDSVQQQWSIPKGILGVPQLGDDLGRYISKIGNPLVLVDKNQRIWLFFVTVSYGGWAGSSLNVMFSDDLAQTWDKPKRLVTSPFINVSTLVRNTPYMLEDGSVIVPVYHEFVAQFPELLRLSATGEILEKVRMFEHGGGIQPSLVQGGAGEAYAFMRSGSHTQDWKVIRLKSFDEGQTWQDFTLTELPNPNSAQIVAKVDESLWVWIGNHNPNNRQDLTLAVSHHLEQPWQVIYQFEQGQDGDTFSYPAITQSKDGIWHLLYTYKRKNIKHIQFNQAWLKQVMQKAGVQ